MVKIELHLRLLLPNKSHELKTKQLSHTACNPEWTATIKSYVWKTYEVGRAFQRSSWLPFAWLTRAKLRHGIVVYNEMNAVIWRIPPRYTQLINVHNSASTGIRDLWPTPTVLPDVHPSLSDGCDLDFRIFDLQVQCMPRSRRRLCQYRV